LTVADVVAKIGWKLGNWVVDLLISQVHTKKKFQHCINSQFIFSQVSKDFKELEVDFVEMGFYGYLLAYLLYLLTTEALYVFLCVCPLIKLLAEKKKCSLSPGMFSDH